MRLRFLYLLLIILPALLTGCYKEYYEKINPEKEVFNFIVTDSQRLVINKARGRQFCVTKPLPVLRFAGEEYTITRFEIRGDNTLNFTRKSYGVNMDRKIKIFNPSTGLEIRLDEFKLLSMVYDYTYIENSTVVGLYKVLDIWPVYSFFTEVRLNNHSQGLYHFIEDPFEYFIDKENSACVIRRGYAHTIKKIQVNPNATGSVQFYTGRFNHIYALILQYSGQELYDSLSDYINLEQYFAKLSVDMLVKNGDYTDEVIFYSRKVDNKEILCAFPWDVDDVFSDQPHEIGRDWAVGTLFGNRSYTTMDDIYSDVGLKLIYSIEDDLDYKIVKDSILYAKYLVTLRSAMEKIDDAAIDRLCDYTAEHIGPFIKNKSVVEQSKLDVDSTTYDQFVENLAEKRQFLKDRRNWILEQLDLQQNP